MVNRVVKQSTRRLTRWGGARICLPCHPGQASNASTNPSAHRAACAAGSASRQEWSACHGQGKPKRYAWGRNPHRGLSNRGTFGHVAPRLRQRPQLQLNGRLAVPLVVQPRIAASGCARSAPRGLPALLDVAHGHPYDQPNSVIARDVGLMKWGPYRRADACVRNSKAHGSQRWCHLRASSRGAGVVPCQTWHPITRTGLTCQTQVSHQLRLVGRSA